MGRVSDSREKLMKAVTELIWVGSYGSTTVDQICAAAGVRKGTFYHFFESKSELAEAAIESEWEDYKTKLDSIFSASIPAMKRIGRYCRFEYDTQVELKKRHGFALGCPLCTLGTEVSTLETGLRNKVIEVMEQAKKYFESAIRDAHWEGALQAPDATAKAQTVYAYVEGLMSQVRIHDDVDLLLDMEKGIHDILGIKETVTTTA